MQKSNEILSLDNKNLCFLGDNIQDFEILWKVGLSCCPITSQQIVNKHSIFTSKYSSGKGLVRDISNLIIHNL